MTKRFIILLASLVLVVPVLFYGCSGDNGSDGAAGAPGAPGAPGDNGATGPAGPGAVSSESCTTCHGTGKDLAVDPVHRIGASPGSVSFTINSVEYGAPVGDNVPVTVNFTFSAKDSAGTDITNKIDLRTTTSGNFGGANDNLSYVRVSAAKLVAGTNGDSDEYSAFIMRPGTSGSGPYYTSASNGNSGAVFTYDNVTGAGSYRLPDNAVRVSDGYDNVSVPIRVAVQISGLPVALFTSDPFLQTSLKRPVANAIFDQAPDNTAITVFKTDVSTTAPPSSPATSATIRSGSTAAAAAITSSARSATTPRSRRLPAAASTTAISSTWCTGSTTARTSGSSAISPRSSCPRPSTTARRATPDRRRQTTPTATGRTSRPSGAAAPATPTSTSRPEPGT